MKKLVLISLLTSALFACQFNTDCNPGSKCLKSGSSLYGSCVGGISPGNSNDKKPVRYINDISGKKGNTCQFNTDCGLGGNCAKNSGSIYGTCM